MSSLGFAWLFAGTSAVHVELHRSASAAGGGAVSGQPPLEHSSPDPWGRDWKTLLDRMKFITIDTRSSAEYLPILGIPGISAVNTAAGRSCGRRYKFTCYVEWLKGQDPDTLIVALDTDVLYGGCDIGLFVREFLQLTQAAKRKVVVGAEFGIFPKTDSKTKEEYAAKDELFLKVHAAFGSHPDSFTKVADGCKQAWSAAPCSDPPQYKFVNNGFQMGQAKDLLATFSDALEPGVDFDDQAAMTELYLNTSRTDLILDVTGRLCLAMYGFGDADTTLHWLRAEGKLATSLYEHPVCFTHWNGRSRGIARRWYPSLTNTPPFNR